MQTCTRTTLLPTVLFPEIYQNNNNNLLFKIPLRHSRVKSASVVLNEELYIIGGKSSTDNYYSKRTTEKITMAIRDACKTDAKAVGCKSDVGVADPPEPIYAHCAVNFDGKIWIIGGMTGESAEEKTSETVHTLEDGSWTEGPPLKIARYCLFVCRDLRP